MQPLQPFYIAGSASGLQTDKRPFLLPDQAYPIIENAYVFRDRVVKREGLRLTGRLRRSLVATAAGNYTTVIGTNTFSIFTGLGITATEPNAEVELGNLTAITITFAAPIGQSLTNVSGTQTMVVVGAGPITSAIINYSTGIVTITASAAVGPAAVTLTLAYYPRLPVMGIPERELAGINLEQSVFFDTKYAYVKIGTQFQEFITAAPNTWAGTDTDFFWGTNYRGSTPESRLFFVTNFRSDAADPMRYTSGAVWVDFIPLVSATDSLFQAKILIPYYGRLLALNVWEGETGPGAGAAVNIFNRCRFSQIGNPVAVDSWRSDIFGKGGFIDAPTNEAIMSARFFKNTLIVGFERSTWQLRYVGEYGLPFIWERISSDFGADSTFSTVLFDDGVLQVGDRAITAATSTNVSRIDEQIPDLVFTFRNDEDGKERVQGIRDFQRELVFWSYVDPDFEVTTDAGKKFPNTTLVYNYKNGTYAKFRNSVTAFGQLQNLTSGTLWSSEEVFWDDEDVFWSDEQENAEFPFIVCGNQQGFIHEYGYTTVDEASLAIQAIDLTTTPVTITSPSHNLQNSEIIFITGTLFDPTDPGLNGFIYSVQYIDPDTFGLMLWNGSNYANVTSTSLSTYQGGGTIALFPRLLIQTKDFNPYQDKGLQAKISYIDFLFDSLNASAVTCTLFVNSSLADEANILIGNLIADGSPVNFGYITGVALTNPCIVTSANHGLRTGDTIVITNVMGTVELNGITFTVTYIDSDTFSLDGIDATVYTAYISEGLWQNETSIYYLQGSAYAWHRFYSTCNGQFLRIQISYGNDLMNEMSTHMTKWVMNAIALYVRPGGKQIF